MADFYGKKMCEQLDFWEEPYTKADLWLRKSPFRREKPLDPLAWSCIPESESRNGAEGDGFHCFLLTDETAGAPGPGTVLSDPVQSGGRHPGILTPSSVLVPQCPWPAAQSTVERDKMYLRSQQVGLGAVGSNGLKAQVRKTPGLECPRESRCQSVHPQNSRSVHLDHV